MLHRTLCKVSTLLSFVSTTVQLWPVCILVHMLFGRLALGLSAMESSGGVPGLISAGKQGSCCTHGIQPA